MYILKSSDNTYKISLMINKKEEHAMIKLMTPGPTQVRENVRMARSKATTNPDLDLEFYDFYKDTCRLYSSLLHTDNESFLLSGEGILGLEAAVCSITEPKDRVLVLDNGVFGKGFADFVKIYGGEPVVLSMDYTKEIDTVKLKEFLDKDSDFKYATVVHCDTPSGMLNDIKVICPLLKSYGIMTVVDSVSGMFGNYVNVDEAQIDILCGGSQKALSAPIGITMVTLSNDAKKVINERKTPIASFYCNLKTMFSYYEDKWFPYSMPISDIMGIRQALENIKEDKDILKRHERLAKKTRQAVLDMGLELYGKNGYSNTVTVFKVPDSMTANEILDRMKKEYDIMLAGSFDVLAGEVIRIGHMGENANDKDVDETLDALRHILKR